MKGDAPGTLVDAHMELGQQLKAHRKQEQPIPCWCKLSCCTSALNGGDKDPRPHTLFSQKTKTKMQRTQTGAGYTTILPEKLHASKIRLKNYSSCWTYSRNISNLGLAERQRCESCGGTCCSETHPELLVVLLLRHVRSRGDVLAGLG